MPMLLLQERLNAEAEIKAKLTEIFQSCQIGTGREKWIEYQEVWWTEIVEPGWVPPSIEEDYVLAMNLERKDPEPFRKISNEVDEAFKSVLKEMKISERIMQ